MSYRPDHGLGGACAPSPGLQRIESASHAAKGGPVLSSTLRTPLIAGSSLATATSSSLNSELSEGATGVVGPDSLRKSSSRPDLVKATPGALGPVPTTRQHKSSPRPVLVKAIPDTLGPVPTRLQHNDALSTALGPVPTPGPSSTPGPVPASAPLMKRHAHADPRPVLDSQVRVGAIANDTTSRRSWPVYRLAISDRKSHDPPCVSQILASSFNTITINDTT